MDIDIEIDNCCEDDYAPRGKVPLTLKEAGIDRILNRRILAWAPKGSYGMGGNGFFGIQLEKKEHYPKEWLFLAYFGSYGWILLNGETVDPNERQRKLPGEPVLAVTATMLGPLNFLLLPFIMVSRLIDQMTKPQANGDWSNLVGAKICAVDITEHHSAITIEKLASFAVLEVPLPGPVFPKGRWFLKGSHLEAWKISKLCKIYCR